MAIDEHFKEQLESVLDAPLFADMAAQGLLGDFLRDCDDAGTLGALGRTNQAILAAAEAQVAELSATPAPEPPQASPPEAPDEGELDLNGYLDTYIDLYRTKFSKGTSRTSQKDLKGKLEHLVRHYMKMPHPFTTCVRDNRKRFGPGAERVCAVLKDIGRGTTYWRGKGKKDVSALTPQEHIDLTADVPAEWVEFTFEQVAEMPDEAVADLTAPRSVPGFPPPETPADLTARWEQTQAAALVYELVYDEAEPLGAALARTIADARASAGVDADAAEAVAVWEEIRAAAESPGAPA